MPLKLKWKRGKKTVDPKSGGQATTWTTEAIDGDLHAQIFHVTLAHPDRWICHVRYAGHAFKFEHATGLKSAKEAVGDFIRRQGN